ncbi:MAG: YjbE family putative metal transport protein [Pseudomonadota bacterium]
MIADASTLLAVILIDLALSADNAVALGLAAAALPEKQRTKAVTLGVFIGLLLRILFGLAAIALLRIHGLLLAGGLLLIWIAWRMWMDIQAHGRLTEPASPGAAAAVKDCPPRFSRVLLSIVAANIALSLDNVLAVAGVSRNAPAIMVFGLLLSVLLTGVAATVIARIIDRQRWVAVLGVLAIVFAAGMMIWDDLARILPTAIAAAPPWLAGGEP